MFGFYQVESRRGSSLLTQTNYGRDQKFLDRFPHATPPNGARSLRIDPVPVFWQNMCFKAQPDNLIKMDAVKIRVSTHICDILACTENKAKELEGINFATQIGE